MNTKRIQLALVILFLTISAVLTIAADQSPSFTSGSPENAASFSPLGVPQAVVLGAVEGITEYLPVSSTGHLLITEDLLGMWKNPEEKAAANAYAICIQLGAILAVFFIFFGRIRQMVLGIFGRDPKGLKLFANLIVAVIPAAVIGILLEDRLKQYLYGVWPIVFAWLVGGIFILFAMRRKGTEGGLSLDELTWRKALLIGLIQCFALWPGVSRSLATLATAMLLGYSVSAAVEFSFLLGLVTLGGTTIYEGLRRGREIVSIFGWVNPLIGLLVAAVTAFVAVKWMISYLTKRSPVVFGWYRIGVAVLVAALAFGGLV
jgi:undecaprenyl-diphosphatase